MSQDATPIPTGTPSDATSAPTTAGTTDPAPVVPPADIIPAYRSKFSWLRFLVPAFLGLIADLALKAWAFPEGVPASPAIGAGRAPAGFVPPEPIIPGLLRFTTTVNHGAVFGIGQGHVLLFLGFSIVALCIILWVFVTSHAKQRVVHIALGLITAGALGNLYDRAVHRGVRDMLQFYASWYQYIFNIADVLLCVGVPLLMARWIFVKDDPLRMPPTAAPQPAQNPAKS